MHLPAGVREIWPDRQNEEAEVRGETFSWNYAKLGFWKNVCHPNLRVIYFQIIVLLNRIQHAQKLWVNLLIAVSIDSTPTPQKSNSIGGNYFAWLCKLATDEWRQTHVHRKWQTFFTFPTLFADCICVRYLHAGDRAERKGCVTSLSLPSQSHLSFFLYWCSKKVHGKGKVGGRWKWIHSQRDKKTLH